MFDMPKQLFTWNCVRVYTYIERERERERERVKYSSVNCNV